MKATPSFQCHIKSEDRKPKLEVYDSDTIDLTKQYGDRRVDRKMASTKHIRRTDEVIFIDLPGSYDYDAYFQDCLDPKLQLMIKGPFANLHWSFTAIDEIRRAEFYERRVRY